MAGLMLWTEATRRISSPGVGDGGLTPGGEFPRTLGPWWRVGCLPLFSLVEIAFCNLKRGQILWEGGFAAAAEHDAHHRATYLAGSCEPPPRVLVNC